MPLPKAMKQLQSIGFNQADLQIIKDILNRSSECVTSNVVIEVADPVRKKMVDSQASPIIGERSKRRSAERRVAGAAR